MGVWLTQDCIQMHSNWCQQTNHRIYIIGAAQQTVQRSSPLWQGAEAQVGFEPQTPELQSMHSNHFYDHINMLLEITTLTVYNMYFNAGSTTLYVTVGVLT